MIAKVYKMVARRENQVMEIAEGIISSATDVGGGEEGEDVFGGLWEFPELQHC
jgi:hypothetical protein